jgi:hypothetical protein
MPLNSIGGALRRLATEITDGPERTIVSTLENLQTHPQDQGLLDSVARLLSQDSKTFMNTVLTHFSVLAAGMGANGKADPDSFSCGMAKKWQNYVATQTAEPFEIACPKTLPDLQAVLAKAKALGCPVRAAGSHHAWSDAALTDGIAIETHSLLEPLVAADATLLKEPADAVTLMRVSGGRTIQDLNTALNQRGLALINMGGFDGQTLAGVISSSTHGSGLSLGAFPSFVEALIVINADGQTMQIEKAGGITQCPGLRTSLPHQIRWRGIDLQCSRRFLATFPSVRSVRRALRRGRFRWLFVARGGLVRKRKLPGTCWLQGVEAPR